MRASSRLILPSIVFLWVNSHPNEECFSVGRAIDCRGIYTKSIGRWFDSGCWDLHFFLRARWPRPIFCSETQTRSNGAYWYSKWNLRLYGRPGLLYASEDCHGPRQHLATRFRRVREEPKEPRNQGTKEPRNTLYGNERKRQSSKKNMIPLKHTKNLLKRERNYDEDCAARASRCRPASRKNARSSPVSVKVRRGAGARATAAGASPVSVKVRRATGGRATAAGAAPDRPLPSLRTPPLAVFFFTAKPPSQIERCARRGGGFRALSSWARERGVRSASSRFSRARSQSGVQSSLRATRPVRRHHRADRGRRSLAAPRTPRRRRCGRGRCRGTPASIAQRRD